MPNAKKIQTAKELPLGKKIKWVLKNSELGKTKGTRIQINELENGYVSGLIKSPLFTGMSIVKRHSKIQGYLKKKTVRFGTGKNHRPPDGCACRPGIRQSRHIIPSAATQKPSLHRPQKPARFMVSPFQRSRVRAKLSDEFVKRFGIQLGKKLRPFRMRCARTDNARIPRDSRFQFRFAGTYSRRNFIKQLFAAFRIQQHDGSSLVVIHLRVDRSDIPVIAERNIGNTGDLSVTYIFFRKFL